MRRRMAPGSALAASHAPHEAPTQRLAADEGAQSVRPATERSAVRFRAIDFGVQQQHPPADVGRGRHVDRDGRAASAAVRGAGRTGRIGETGPMPGDNNETSASAAGGSTVGQPALADRPWIAKSVLAAGIGALETPGRGVTGYRVEAALPPGRHCGGAGRNGRDLPCLGQGRRVGGSALQ